MRKLGPDFLPTWLAGDCEHLIEDGPGMGVQQYRCQHCGRGLIERRGGGGVRGVDGVDRLC